MTTITVNGNQVEIDSNVITVPYSISKAIWLPHLQLVVILMDFNENIGERRFRNILAYDLEGNLAWIAELPSESGADRYTDLGRNTNGLHAFSFSCHYCMLDMVSGKIESQSFTK